MKAGIFTATKQRAGLAALGLAIFAMIWVAGCKTQAPVRTDQQVASDIQAKIQGESALSGQNIQVSVADGVATLSGTVTDEASRALAGNDSGTVNGVKTVVNNLTVQPAQQAGSMAPVAPRTEEAATPPPSRDRHESRSASRQDSVKPMPQQQMAPPQQQQAQMTPPPAPAAPAAPPQPVVKEITLAVGTVIPVRISEALDTKTAQPNDVFHGALASDLGGQGVIAIRQGAPIVGRVIDAREAAHFKGSSLLSLELTEMMAGGKKVSLVTDPYVQEGAGRGKNTAVKAGGGAVLGAIIGGIAGGGKGAAIGTLAGGAAGTGVNAATRGEQVVIPAETLVNFQLSSPITVRVTVPPAEDSGSQSFPEPQLQHR
jgi:BON domain